MSEPVLVAVASRLADDHVTAAMFRRVVDEFAPVPILSERIDACRRLVDVEVSRAPVHS